MGHRFCKDCFEGYCSSKINEANVSDKELVCPAPKCGTPVTIHELEGNLSADMLARYTKVGLIHVRVFIWFPLSLSHCLSQPSSAL